MRPSVHLVILITIMATNYAQVTVKKNPILSRKKRYLVFPEGSNFVATMSYIKSVMVLAPKLVNVLGECDVPFKLPSDFRHLRGTKAHYKQKREVYSQLEDALNENGLNGSACVRRIICDAQRFLPPKGTSLVGDLLSSVFTFSVGEPLEDDDALHDVCHADSYENCKISFMDYILGSFLH